MDTPEEAGPGPTRSLGSLSRFLDPADYDVLRTELVVVDCYWDSKQHLSRRWEYAIALRALLQAKARRVIDVGGAGSPFYQMAMDAEVVDPNIDGVDLAEYVRRCPRLADGVTCLSVLEHVPDEAQFLYHLSCLVAPGGVLVLTMDAVGENALQDTYHFRWMRERIYSPRMLWDVVAQLAHFGFWLESDPDFTYPGPQVYDYSAASLVLRKRP